MVSPIEVFTQLGINEFIIPFLLVAGITYGILMKYKFISESSTVNGLIAFSVGFMTVLTVAGKIISLLVPYLIIFGIVLFIGLMMFMILGLKEKDLMQGLTHPVFALFIIVLITILTFVALQDYLIFSDRIPAWKVSETGEIIGERYNLTTPPGGVTNISEKPHSIIVEGSEYVLINGMYYKGGYQGIAYSLGSPQVLGAIIILIVLALGTMLITWPQKGK